jgi:dGTPase
LQVLDGILSHDGEAHLERLAPDREKSFADFVQDIEGKQNDPHRNLKPMTLEGCVVRLADTISYIGRDLEDAILLELIHRPDLPPLVKERLGETNGTIIYTLVTDLITQSLNKNYVSYSAEIGEALRSLKEFNYRRIYQDPRIKAETDKIADLFATLFNRFHQDVEQDQRSSPIWQDFLLQMDQVYLHNHQPAEMVRDFLSSMTDAYFLRQCQDLFFPRTITVPFK